MGGAVTLSALHAHVRHGSHNTQSAIETSSYAHSGGGGERDVRVASVMNGRASDKHRMSLIQHTWRVP